VSATTDAVTLRVVPYNGPEATQLVAEVQEEYVARYGSADVMPVAAEHFEAPDGVFLVADVGGRLAGCGAVRRHGPRVAEIKRMYVRPDARGAGVSRALLAGLESFARGRDYLWIVLETGDRQPEAVGLYTSSGYVRVPPFGDYAADPHSFFFGREL
jgi:GNAT superfamily N-acetyltransferase